MMISFLLSQIKRVLQFSGREKRQPFWLWVAVVMGAQMVAGIALIAPIMVQTIMRIERFASQHPDQITRTYGPGSYSVQIHGYHPEIMPDFGAFAFAIGLVALMTVVLLAAAIVRRLHDSNQTGLWGMLPLPFLIAGLVLFPSLIPDTSREAAPNMGLFVGLFFNNLVYLIMIGILVFKLVRPGTPGDNRFGPLPQT